MAGASTLYFIRFRYGRFRALLPTVLRAVAARMVSISYLAGIYYARARSRRECVRAFGVPPKTLDRLRLGRCFRTPRRRADCLECARKQRCRRRPVPPRRDYRDDILPDGLRLASVVCRPVAKWYCWASCFTPPGYLPIIFRTNSSQHGLPRPTLVDRRPDCLRFTHAHLPSLVPVDFDSRSETRSDNSRTDRLIQEISE